MSGLNNGNSTSINTPMAARPKRSICSINRLYGFRVQNAYNTREPSNVETESYLNTKNPTLVEINIAHHNSQSPVGLKVAVNKPAYCGPVPSCSNGPTNPTGAPPNASNLKDEQEFAVRWLRRQMAASQTIPNNTDAITLCRERINVMYWVKLDRSAVTVRRYHRRLTKCYVTVQNS